MRDVARYNRRYSTKENSENREDIDATVAHMHADPKFNSIVIRANVSIHRVRSHAISLYNVIKLFAFYAISAD